MYKIVICNQIGILSNKLTNLAEYKGDESVYLVGKWFGYNLYQMQFSTIVTGSGVSAEKEIEDFDFAWVDISKTFFKRGNFYLPVGYNNSQVYVQKINGQPKVIITNENYTSPCNWYVNVYLAKST